MAKALAGVLDDRVGDRNPRDAGLTPRRRQHSVLAEKVYVAVGVAVRGRVGVNVHENSLRPRGTAGMSAHCPDIPAAVSPVPAAAVTTKATWSPWVAVTGRGTPHARAGHGLQHLDGGAERSPTVD
jgi:hypothetical protein